MSNTTLAVGGIFSTGSYEPGCNIGSRQDDQVKLPSMLLEIIRHRRIKRLMHDFDADVAASLAPYGALSPRSAGTKATWLPLARIALTISTIRKEPAS